jgi:hypothetical protein
MANALIRFYAKAVFNALPNADRSPLGAFLNMIFSGGMLLQSRSSGMRRMLLCVSCFIVDDSHK